MTCRFYKTKPDRICKDFLRRTLDPSYLPRPFLHARSGQVNYNNKTNTVSSVHALNTQPNQRSLSPPFYSSPFLSCLLPFAPLSSPPPSASDWASADDRLWLSSFSLLLLSRSESRRRPSSRLRWFFWCRSKDDDLSRPPPPPPPPPWFCWLTTRPLISFGLFLRSCAKTTSSSHPLMRKRSISSRASRAWSGSAYSMNAKPFACCEW